MAQFHTLHIPVLQREEVWLGYQGRLWMANPGWNPSELKRAIRHHFGLRPRSGYGLLAAVAGREYREFVMQHTLVPLSYHRGRSRRCLTISYARYCEKCAIRDIATIGFPYWRRLHQVRGVDWCLRHETALITLGGTEMFDALPLPWQPTLKSKATDEERRHPTVQRYIGAMNDRLRSGCYIFSDPCIIHLRDLGEKANTRYSALPRQWVQRHFHDLRGSALRDTPAEHVLKLVLRDEMAA